MHKNQKETMNPVPNHSQPKLGVIFIGRRRPGFDMEWGRRMEERVRGWLPQTGFVIYEPPEKATDDASLRRTMAACDGQRVDAIVLLQTTMGDGRLAPTLAQLWPDPLILWATPENPEGDMISSCSLVGTHNWASVLRQLGHRFELVNGAPEAAARDGGDADRLGQAGQRERAGDERFRPPLLNDEEAARVEEEQQDGQHRHTAPGPCEAVQGKSHDGFGGDARRAGALCAEWIDACQAESVLACAKHFPGHGHVAADSHLEIPVDERGLDALANADLIPFGALVAHGLDGDRGGFIQREPADPGAEGRKGDARETELACTGHRAAGGSVDRGAGGAPVPLHRDRVDDNAGRKPSGRGDDGVAEPEGPAPGEPAPGPIASRIWIIV